MDPLLSLKSKIAGKNADVRVFPDRVEHTASGRMGTGSKAALGAVTMGASLIATGLSSKKDHTVIPIKAITSVSSRRDGLLNSVVTLATSTGTIEARCSHDDAKKLAETVQRLILA